MANLLTVTAINGQVYGIDPHMESAHFITDILSNDNELFLISQDGMYEKRCNAERSIPSEGKLFFSIERTGLIASLAQTLVLFFKFLQKFREKHLRVRKFLGIFAAPWMQKHVQN